jgi:hypothetical protein
MTAFLRLSGFSLSSSTNRYVDGGLYNMFLTNEEISPILQVIPINLPYKRPIRDSNNIQWKNCQYYRKSLPTVINATYDLDICKSYFDGDNLYVRCWEKLFRRSDYIKCNMKFAMHYYQNNNEEEPTNMDKTESRLKKYRSRGFNIELHPQNSDIITYITDIMKLPHVKNGVQAVNDNLLNLDLFYVE